MFQRIACVPGRPNAGQALWSFWTICADVNVLEVKNDGEIIMRYRLRYTMGWLYQLNSN
jgi:hypothetical protein